MCGRKTSDAKTPIGIITDVLPIPLGAALFDVGAFRSRVPALSNQHETPFYNPTGISVSS